jgi:hemerythrin-like domain-containing protein
MDQHPAMEFFFHSHRELNAALPKISVTLQRMDHDKHFSRAAIGELIAEVDLLRRDVEEHFRAEENVLFPVLVKALPELEGPVTGLLSEHDDMRYCVNGLCQALGRIHTDRAAIREALTYATNYTRCLADHTGLEDRTLYRYASNHLGEAQFHQMHLDLERTLAR